MIDTTSLDGRVARAIEGLEVDCCARRSGRNAKMARVLKPGGRLQVGDILVQKAVGESGKRNIDLWKVESPALCWKQSWS